MAPTISAWRRISVGGELVSEGLKERAHRLFGPVEVYDDYGMTETWPFQGQSCSEGHLHFDPTSGMLEVIDPETGNTRSARSGWNHRGDTASAVPRSYYPAPLRYTRRGATGRGPPHLQLAHTCKLQAPYWASSSLAARHEGGWTFARDVLEALEGTEEVPLPARYGFWAVPGGVGVEVVVRSSAEPRVRRAIETRLEERGVPVRELNLVEHRGELQRPVPLRCDLKEASFGGLVIAEGAFSGLTPNETPGGRTCDACDLFLCGSSLHHKRGATGLGLLPQLSARTSFNRRPQPRRRGVHDRRNNPDPLTFTLPSLCGSWRRSSLWRC